MSKSHMFIISKNGATLSRPRHWDVALCLNTMKTGERSVFVFDDIVYHVNVYEVINVRNTNENLFIMSTALTRCGFSSHSAKQ